MKAICEQVSDYGIEEALQNIPQDMDATYERILDIIDKKPPAQRELARKALLFVAYARKPVSIDVLALAIAVKDRTQSLEALRSSISTEKTIINACGNLLSIKTVDTSFYARQAFFVHFSVYEFLTSHRFRFFKSPSLENEVAHREIAKRCISFLLILYSHLRLFCTNIERHFAHDYILDELPHHLLAGNLNSLSSDDEMIDLTLLLFQRGLLLHIPHPIFSPQMTIVTFSPPVLALIFNLPGTYQCYNRQALCDNQFDNKAAAWVYGLNSFHWFGRVHNLTRQVFDDRLAMHFAIGQLDSVAVGQRLYTHGYPVDYRSDFDRSSRLKSIVLPVHFLTPLYLVKSEEAARFLLNSGASVNPQGVRDELPNLLEYIAGGGNAKIIQVLLDNSVKQDEKTQRNTLQILACENKIEALKLLLDKGADVNAQGGEYGSALQAAAATGNSEVIELLLDKGADVNLHGGKYVNALQAAIREYRVKAVQLLLDKGAEVNAQGGKYGNALQTAAYIDLNPGERLNALSGKALQEANAKIIRLLLDKGADVDAVNGKYGSALQAAAYTGNKEAIELLLDKGADVNAQGGRYGSALQAAAANWRIKSGEAIQLLLDKGADVNARGGEHGSALKAAISIGNEEAMELLLDKGADVNAQGGRYGSALQAAAACWNGGKVIQLLLDKGADVNALGGRYGSALKAAISIGNEEAMELLLDKGADVNAQGGMHGSALQAAAAHGDSGKVIQLLLDKGADVNAPGGWYGSALQAAAYSSDNTVLELLLDNGADVNAQGGKYGSALHAAAYQGRNRVIQLLLDKEAIDVNALGGEGSALQAAAANCRIKSGKAIQLLLDKGADINALGGEYGSALQTAACIYTGTDEIIELLLDKGADVNAQGGRYGSALQAAVAHGDSGKAIHLLLDKGADVNAPGGWYGSALQAAAYSNDYFVIKLLLNKGADVNALGGKYGSALQAAAYRGYNTVIQLLLDKGADVNALGGKYGSALQAAAACRNGGKDIQLLLDKGADVNAQGGVYGTALQAALRTVRPSRQLPPIDQLHMAKILLDHGADFTAHVPNSKYGDALSAAKELWKNDEAKLASFMKLLKSKGWKEDRSGTTEIENKAQV